MARKVPRAGAGATILTHGGCHPREHLGIVTPRVYRASHHPLPHPGPKPMGLAGAAITRGFTYGLSGTPTTFVP